MDSDLLKSSQPVHPSISDLFFNTDLSEAELYDGRDKFIGYEPDRIAHEAIAFLDALRSLGVQNLPSAEDLLIDFYGRQADAG